MRVVVAIVNFNGRQSTSEAIDSVLPTLAPDDRILVVDNASMDGSVEFFAERYPSVRVIALPRNRGYSGGCNAAIDFALREGAEFVLLANNDIAFAPDTIERLVGTAKLDAQIAVVVPRIYYSRPPDRVWAAGSIISRVTGLTRQRGMDRDEADFPPSPEPVDLDMCTGCALLVRTSVVATVGPMRDSFFLYYDETDWCWRIRRAGFRIVLEDRARLWHKVSESVGVSSPTFWFYITRNHILFVHLDFPPSRRLVALLYIVGVNVPHRVLLLWAQRSPSQATAILRGCAAGLREMLSASRG